MVKKRTDDDGNSIALPTPELQNTSDVHSTVSILLESYRDRNPDVVADKVHQLVQCSLSLARMTRSHPRRTPYSAPTAPNAYSGRQLEQRGTVGRKVPRAGWSESSVLLADPRWESRLHSTVPGHDPIGSRLVFRPGTGRASSLYVLLHDAVLIPC
jgi:hypothetical protein